MHRAAVLAFPDDQGEPQARLILERVQWERADAGAYLRGERPRTAAWLMCNPSRASHEIDDPTAGRVVHHSARAGCPRSLVGNVWPYRTPYPVDLWAAIARGELTDDMMAANLDALCMIGAQADIHIVAFGAAPQTKAPVAVARAVEAFSLYGNVPLYCLGTNGAVSGSPLHPLARGKFAVRNDAQLRLWRGVNPVLPWEQVFSDKQRVAGGWVDKLSAYEEGRAAHRRGVRTLITSNPYERGTTDHGEWLRGWTDHGEWLRGWTDEQFAAWERTN